MNHLQILLTNCLAIIRDSTNFNEPQNIADTNWLVNSKRPIPRDFGNEHHRGEIAEFTFGIDKELDGIYVCFANSGDEIIASNTQDFINYINLWKPN